MYMDNYKRWMQADLEDTALSADLESIAGNEDEIIDLLGEYKQYEYLCSASGYTRDCKLG